MFSYVAMEKRRKGGARGMVEAGKGEGRKERKRLEGEMQTHIEDENEKKSEAMRPSHIEIENPQPSIAENASPRLTSSPVEDGDAKTWRVLQTPIKRDQHVLVDVCSPEGTLERRVFSKRKMKDDLEKYRLIRKAEWGGELSLCTVWFNKHNIRSQELASLFLVLLLLSNTQLLLRHVDTVQELTDILVAHQHAQVDLRGYLSLFQRKNIPEIDTASMSFPSRMISSFWASDLVTVTPSCIWMWRTRFSPRKLRISTLVPSLLMATLMGK